MNKINNKSYIFSFLFTIIVKNKLFLSSMRKIVITTMLMLISFTFVLGQRNVKDSAIGTPWIAVHYGANWTHEDLAVKFGYLNHIGTLAGYKTKKNWFYGLEANFIYGNQVHLNGMFTHLLDSKGTITDVNGDIGRIVVSSRGFNTNLVIGKIIPVLSTNNNSGIFINFGVGFLSHRYRIDTQDQVIPGLELNYRKGYDRYSLGPNLSQFVGYTFMSNLGLVNFYGGFYAQEGFTKNQRTIFFDKPNEDVPQKTMLDIQVGLKLGWLIPIYKRQPKEFYID
jgi:hypothetical protein